MGLVKKSNSIYRLVMLIGIMGFIKTIYYNFRYMRFSDAIKLPLICSGKCRISECKRGNIIFPNGVRTGQIRIGIGSTQFNINMSSVLFIGGRLVVNTTKIVNLTAGTAIGISYNAKLQFNGNFECGQFTRLVAHDSIEFGDKVVLQHNVTVMDHETYVVNDKNGNKVNPTYPIYIGNNVWIQPYVFCGPGTRISSNVIISSNSCIDTDSDAILQSVQDSSGFQVGGIPLRLQKRDVTTDFKVNFGEHK